MFSLRSVFWHCFGWGIALCSACCPPTKDPLPGPTLFDTDVGSTAIVSADFNKDTFMDLAVANDVAGTVSILQGNGMGGFTLLANHPVGKGLVSLAAGKFNQDDELDLVVTSLQNNNLSVLLGDGQGGFGVATHFVAGTGPIAVVTGDFNQDQKLDLAVANSDAGGVSILLGDGTGKFGAATSFVAGDGPAGLVAVDMNGDHKLDLAVANHESNDVSVLLGTGTGSFGTAINATAEMAPDAIAVGDFDGDGKLDVVVANSRSNTLSALGGDGTGKLRAALREDLRSARFPKALAVGDLNGDQLPDLIVVSAQSNSLSVLLGARAQLFMRAIELSTGCMPDNKCFPDAIAVGDFNQDNSLDVAVANHDRNNVALLLGTGQGTFGTGK